MRYVLGVFLLAVSFAGVPASADQSFVGTWSCKALKGGDPNVQVATFTADGKITAKTSDGTATYKYTYAGGVLTETVQGYEIKSKVVWKSADAFDLIVSDPDMTSRSCTRAH